MRYHYNKEGILVKAEDPNTRKVHWEAKKALASGKPTEQKLGTHITVKQQYDVMERIERQESSSPQSGMLQLTQVDGERYQYDQAGNQISGGGRDIKWTSYNQPFEIKKTDGSSRLRLAYNADRLRMVKEDKTQGKITWYSGGGRYERIRERDGSEVHKYHLSIGGQAVMYLSQYISAGNTLRAAHTRYLLNDHLGSPMVVTDTHNHALQHLSFNAWGQRRYATWGDFLLRDPKLTVLLEALDQYALTHGFTGHEHDDEVGLIHMKGRLYDPQLGRFISADPFVQAPTNTQSYNRYSYVMNNPLSYTDPSGYFFSKLLGGIGSFVRRWGRTIAAIGIGVISGGIAFSAASGGIFAIGAGASNVLGASIAAGAATGFSSALINTGSPKAAFTAGLLGGLSAGLANAIGHGIPGLGISGVPNDIRRLVAHGVAQGSVSRLQGGKFRSGFAGGFFGHLAGPITSSSHPAVGTTVTATIGGTVSKLSGGKFTNGAATSAFTHMFNYLFGFTVGGSRERPVNLPKFLQKFLGIGGTSVVSVTFAIDHTGTFKILTTPETGISGAILPGSRNEFFARAVFALGYRNTVEDLEGLGVSGSLSAKKLSFSSTLPINENSQSYVLGGLVAPYFQPFARHTPIYEVGYSSITRGVAASTTVSSGETIFERELF